MSCGSGAEDTLRTISEGEVNAVFRKLAPTDWLRSPHEINDIISCLSDTKQRNSQYGVVENIVEELDTLVRKMQCSLLKGEHWCSWEQPLHRDLECCATHLLSPNSYLF
jgi:hypothetical protein